MLSLVFRDCQGKPIRKVWHSCLAMLYEMTFSNTAKSGNVLSSNVTREAEIKNSDGKQPIFQLLNYMLIIYIRYYCSVHPSESITVYLWKQIILCLPTTGLWHFFPQHMVLRVAIMDQILDPKNMSCVSWAAVHKIKK